MKIVSSNRLAFRGRILATLVASVAACALVEADAVAKPQRATLERALAQNNRAAIKNVVAAINEDLGDLRGVPEVADRYVRIPSHAAPLTRAEVMGSIAKAAAQIEQGRWWRVGLDPTQLSRPLRQPASAIIGLLAFSRASDAPGDPYVIAAREAGDFLVWAQNEAGTGVYPFPASRGKSTSAAFRSAERQLARAEKKGLDNIVRNGWAIEDTDDGGLQFDNGECGLAMFALYEATRDKKYLESAMRAASWAASRSLVVNWNYNAFSVRLLARAYLVTGQQSFLDSATQKALLGVIPGQLTSGNNNGRWADPHNARPVYHYIMMDSLAELIAAMRKAKVDNTAAADDVVSALRLGLIARTRDFLSTGKGATTKEAAMLALLNVNTTFANDADFLRITQSRAALDGLTKLVSSQARRGRMPLAPGAWGLFVEHVLKR
ncbi:MAG: hypothetical protein ACRDAM_18505 [Casimicrobium sp.]